MGIAEAEAGNAQAGAAQADTVRERRLFHYYTCAAQVKGVADSQHKNRIGAEIVERWTLQTVEELLQTDSVIEKAIERAGEARLSNQRP